MDSHHSKRSTYPRSRKQPRLRTGTRLRERSREPLGRQSRERLRLRPRERLLSRSRDRLRSRSKERQRSPLTDRYRSPPRKVAISLSRDRWSPLKGRRLSPRELTRSSSGKRISSSSRGGRSIRKIMEDYKVDIRLPRTGDDDPSLVIVSGDDDNVQDCIDHLKLLEEEHIQDVADKEWMKQYEKPNRALVIVS